MSANPFETSKSQIVPEPVEGLPYASGIRRQDLPTNVRKYADNIAAQIKTVYAKYGAENFEELKENKKLSARDARKVADLLKAFNVAIKEKGHVTLRDIPTFTTLPSHEILKDKQTGFKFDWVHEQEYRAGRPLSDFALTDKDLQDIGFNDRQKREGLLQELALAKERKESEPEATVFDIREAIDEKKREDPSRTDFLTTKEVFEAIDAAGCRPATFEELLAFGQQYWKPEVDPEILTDEEKLFRRVNVPYIYALASPFSRSGSGDKRHVQCLGLDGHGRNLLSDSLGGVWGRSSRFLVIRKSRRPQTP
ncbi:MAG: hypothetical protein WC641_01500 [Patescibacteria group bacterium]